MFLNLETEEELSIKLYEETHNYTTRLFVTIEKRTKIDKLPINKK